MGHPRSGCASEIKLSEAGATRPLAHRNSRVESRMAGFDPMRNTPESKVSLCGARKGGVKRPLLGLIPWCSLIALVWIWL